MKINLEVKKGVTRVVFLVGPWAVKVPRVLFKDNDIIGIIEDFTRGLLANISEKRWTDYKQKGINPVIFSLFGLINVYKRLVVNSNVDYSEE